MKHKERNSNNSKAIRIHENGVKHSIDRTRWWHSPIVLGNIGIMEFPEWDECGEAEASGQSALF